MKVDELIIDGFKSYATRTVISGWDSSFNAITGLNGSGKSNILDAICFVLGISSMQTVRASNLQDLIYKRGQAGVTKASVTIVFDNSELTKSPIGFEKCTTISVTRQIILGGTSKYLINGHKAQQNTVLSLFQSVQLNINNPNFLIMQGKITKVLNMRATEILSLIEEAAGTRTFEEKKIKAKKIMVKKDQKLAEIKTLLLEEIEPKFEKFRNDKRVYVEFKNTETALEKHRRFVTAIEYFQLSQSFNNNSEYVSVHEQKIAQLHLEIDKLSHEINNLNEDLKQVKEARDKNLNKDGKLGELEKQENKLSNEIERLKTSRSLTKEEILNETDKLESLRKKQAQLETQLKEGEQTLVNHEKKLESQKKEVEKLKEQFERKEELLTGLSTGLSTKGNASSGYVSQLNEVKNKLSTSKNLISQHKMKIDHLQSGLDSDKPKLSNAKKEYDGFMKNITNLKNSISMKQKNLDEALGSNPQNVTELRDKESRLKQQQNALLNELSNMKQSLRGLDFHYEHPYNNFDDTLVKGVVAQLFDLPESSYDKAIALQTCAGGRLYNVVVDTADVASQLLERGRLRKRVTMIPLDKINPNVVGTAVIERAHNIAPNKVELAINLVEYDPKIQKAMQYVFGTTFICADPDAAKKVTFDPQIRTRSITIEGDTYDPEGNVSGGSRRFNSSILLILRDYNKVLKKLNGIEEELKYLQNEITSWENTMKATAGMRKEIEMDKYELSIQERKLESNQASSILKLNEQRTKEIEALKNEIETNKKNCESYEEEIKQIEKDIKEFSSDKSTKINELKSEVSKLKSNVEKSEEQVALEVENFQVLQWEIDQQKNEFKETTHNIEATTKLIEELNKKEEQDQQTYSGLERELIIVKDQVEEEKTSLAGLDEEMNELIKIISSKNKKSESIKIKIKSIQFELDKANNATTNLKTRLDELMSEHEWVLDMRAVEREISDHNNTTFEEAKDHLNQLEDKFQSIRRKVNVNIMSMIEENEKRESALKLKIKTIEKDKNKIETTIEKLNGEIRKALNATYQKVSEDFGQIFADLLPGSFAKLVPVDMMDVTKGLEVKVKLGPVWKNSLVELSGGQRSLIALSLIMALLQFNPAPMYILDEVDAALDLSHTQNIGHLIKTRFKGSQFIVVSLKEGMFTNANRVFRTRFQDGTSVVSVL
ncbi:SMC2 [Candida pseudojiufengensis]|uniref:SMC2 n=1 Tax=Candida pseudojiufengensis TaxID=497109 RepID=UPI0022254974|nr:SMC2 [Candida pseudojiufengensis]KAI5966920.1 SMC2 [Candida pseudojiufengensis]